ncbi:uncharacterized protein PV09_08501 [Verruconis gallopava]|uniref:Piwi domain-containing protein n=1 Tax=Verruconis gallopava TaxID=253628 RepID=A0A0D1YGB2_9PEZI|nr:uncharacterized protein PV09_08501 [Verruconis gallopava]KIV99831.1 hypothetical protein PV09_08501 [Verruconis gallopava]
MIIAQYDGPKDSDRVPPALVGNMRNLEGLGLSLWQGVHGTKNTNPLPQRGGKFNSLGREVNIGLNTFDVTSLPIKPAQQYDVTIVSDKGVPSRAVQMKVWKSNTLRNALGQGSWLYDGNKLAWATIRVKTLTLSVDLGAEEGSKPNPKNIFHVRVAPTKQVSFTTLQSFLDGRASFDISILETLSFLDHLLREAPSQKFTQIKQNFFARGGERFALGCGVEAYKGVFASVRMTLNAQRKPGLSVNVDVANGTFFMQMDLIDCATQVCRARNVDDFRSMFEKSRGNWHKSNMYKFLKSFTHVSVLKKYDVQGRKEVKVYKFLPKDPYEAQFKKEERDNQGNVIASRTVSIAEYFKQKYNLSCKRGLPVVELSRKGEMVPIEGLTLVPNQRYRTKLDERQTSNMIKFAVTAPNDRWAAVEHGLRMLDWGNDPYLRAYGMRISATPTQVRGRILTTPEPTFSGSKVDARSAAQGRWRIDGKKFYLPNSRPLKNWGFCVVDVGRGPCISQQQAKAFADRFKQIALAHGMNVGGPPHLVVVKAVRGGEMISDAWNGTGNNFQAKPNILFFVVPTKDTDLYRRIKKSCECRYGVVSQVLQSAHVERCQDQYISNVCMKVNAKLGGGTCIASGMLTRMNPKWAKVPTMIIGADVSHASPGDDSSGSKAAFTISLDKHFVRFAAECETNGSRVEIISTHIIESKLKAMVQAWAKSYGGHTPHQVIYFRDGVSEGQFQFVLNQEVADMKAMFLSINPKIEPKFTVIVCGKRHHVRFFPGKSGDRNGNPIPGTLVESGVTHPFEIDFYLASHAAIKGTARPVHYNVIANENNYEIPFIEQLTFEHCLQYVRSTTPVSMVPAVYYAHLASNRATAHKNEATISSGKKEAYEKAKKDVKSSSSSDQTAFEIPPLIPLNNAQGIASTMWYI